ncbi:MAG: DUF6454 family protein [Pseudomonadota bacterium]
MIRKAIRTASTALLLLLLGLTAAAAQQSGSEAIEHTQLLRALRLEGEIFHVQGVDLDSRHIWVTSVDRDSRRGYLHEFDRATGRFLRRLELTDGARYHPGGISLSGGSLWIPVAEMKPNSSAVLEEIDTETLRIRRRIHVADHLGCVAASDRDLVAGNWDSRLLYIFDLRGTEPVRVVPNPSATPFQDIKFVHGQLVGGGPLTLWSGTIDWIDWPSMKHARTLRAGTTDRAAPYTGEGMTLKGRDLYLISEDGPSRLFHFRLDA